MSPLDIFALVVLIVLFIPMQWGAPTGAVRLYQPVVEVIPNVSGEVIEVHARALTPMRRGDVIFRIDPETYEAQVEEIEANLTLAKLNLERSRKLYKTQAAAKVDLDRYTAEVRSLEAQLKEGRWNLDKTVVRAPSNGYLVGLQLRPGQRVGRLAVRSWAAFVDTENSHLIAGIPQTRMRHVRPGQRVEIAFRLWPGQIFDARVAAIVPMTPQGQLQPAGLVPAAPVEQELPLPFAVRLELEDSDVLDPDAIHGGALGTAAIYTESSTITHIIRRVLLRMESWLYYLSPV